MPALPNVPQVIRVRFLFTIQGKLSQGCRIFYEYTGSAPNPTSLNSIAGLIDTQVKASFPTLMTNQNTLTAYALEDLSASTAAASEYATSVPGQETAFPLAAGSSTVSLYEISRRYRGGKPKTFWPLGTSANLNPGPNWESAYLTQAQTAIAAVIAAPLGQTEGGTTISAHVNVSYYSGFSSVENPITHRWRNVPTLRTNPLVDQVASIVVAPYVGSQRLRRQVR